MLISRVCGRFSPPGLHELTSLLQPEFCRPLPFRWAVPKLIRNSLFSGISAPTFPGQALIFSRTARKTYSKISGHRKGCNSSRTVLQASWPTPGSSEGSVGAHIVAAGSDTDEESVKSSSTSPAFAQSTIAFWHQKAMALKSLPKHSGWLTV
jgi:hypothetical protein